MRSLAGEVEEISGPMVLERYVAMADYEKQKKNECSLTAGQMVEVIDKNQNGWWFVSLDNFSEGWVPATYLEPLYGTEEAQVEVFSPGQGIPLPPSSSAPTPYYLPLSCTQNSMLHRVAIMPRTQMN